MKKTVLLLVLAVALVSGLRAQEVVEQVLVKVNGDIITKTELERLQINALRAMPDQSDPAGMSDEEISKALAQITPQVIVNAIDEMLLLQRAGDLGYTVSDEQFTSVVDSIKRDNKLESEEQFQAALAQEGMTLAQLRQMLSKRMLISQVQQREVAGRVGVTEAEEREYYDTHLSEFATTPSVTLREIMVLAQKDAKGVSVGAQEDARAKAEEIRARVLKGESFDKLAAEISDAPSKANGGLIGPIPRTELNDELLKMLGTMKVGGMTPVVAVPDGYAVFKLETSIESTTLPFDSARADIAEKIGTEKISTELKKYLNRLRSQALIEWKNDEIRKAYEVGLSAQPTY